MDKDNQSYRSVQAKNKSKTKIVILLIPVIINILALGPVGPYITSVQVKKSIQ